MALVVSFVEAEVSEILLKLNEAKTDLVAARASWVDPVTNTQRPLHAETICMGEPLLRIVLESMGSDGVSCDPQRDPEKKMPHFLGGASL